LILCLYLVGRTLRMRGKDFYRLVAEDPRLRWLGAREGSTPDEDDVVIEDTTFALKFALSISAIRENSWEDLYAVLTSKRSPRIMTHMTRIVGYYSQLQNWNRSKIAELRDRRKGNYMLPEARSEGDGNVEQDREAATAHAAPREPARV
jgi:hypothetical protein